MADINTNFHFPKYSYRHITSAYIPTIAYVSLMQDGKTLCKSSVKIGDTVTEGQLIALNKNESAYIHSPIPGIIDSFEEHTMPDGSHAECIVIHLKGSFTHTGKEIKQRSWKYDTSSRITSQIMQQGIINTVDTKVGSLSEQIEALSSDEKTLGVLLFDFDPSTTVNKTCLELYQKEIFEGSVIGARAMNADGIIFFCNNKSIHNLRNSQITEILEGVEHCFIPVDSELYPNASPGKLKKLIQKNKNEIGEKFSANMNLCIDTTTAIAIYYGITYELPVTSSFVEVNGPALHESKIYSVKIGTPIKRLLEDCGGTEKNPSKIVVNGLLKGIAVNDLQIPVTKSLKSITLLSSDSIPDQTKSLCIHCGLCRNLCPAKLLPDVLYSYYENNFNIHNEIRLSAVLCDECALCNTTCPSRLPLFQTIANIKKDEHETKI